MKCPRCQQENPPQSKFCLECAAPLAQTCANCGTQLPASAKFCLDCAHPVGAWPATQRRFISPDSYTPKHLAEKILTSKSALEGERKQVTVLFADLKGSMELLADRDPEEARKLLDPVLERMMEAVHRYEGTVNQVMGDGIMGLFGAPVAHEDHAVRACYAALRMQEAIRRYSEDVRGSHGIEVQIRIGLNSGDVVVRAIGNDLHTDYTAVGQTIHLAGRMEQLAPPGSTRLTAQTLRLAEGFIQIKPLGLVPVKGLVDSTEVFELVGAAATRTRWDALGTRGLTNFVGRHIELGVLHQALERAGSGHGQVVAVVGEPGVGKSRLLWEFTHSYRTHSWLVLGSGGVSYGKTTPYLPVIDLFKAYFQIEARDDERKIREKVGGKLVTLDEPLMPTLPALLTLLDVPVDDPQWQALDPPQRRQRTLDAVKRLLLRESQVQPLCLVFEDLHWIDSETQVVLDSLIESLPTNRVLLLVNYRAEYQDARGPKTYYTQLRIDPLPPEGAEELLQSLLGDGASLQALKQLLIARTEGNPFFLEESVRTLLETQVLVGRRGAYRLSKALPSIQVPATVYSVLAARIDRLPPEEKRLLQSASVIGRNVPFALLQAIAEEPEDAVRQALATLQAADFLYETQLFPELEYTFKHALTHEVAYASLMRARRQALHAAAGRAVEAHFADHLEEVYDRLAYHYSKTEQADKAVHYLMCFAKKAARGHSHVEAVAAIQESLVHADRLPRDRRDLLLFDLVLHQVQSLNFLGRNQESLDLLLQQGERIEQLQDPSRAAPYYFSLGLTVGLLGDQRRAIQSLKQSVEEAKRCGDERTMGRAYALLTLESYWSGQPDQGIEYSRHAVTVLERTQQRYWLALAYFYTAAVGYLMGELQQTLEAAARANTIGQAITNLGVQSFAASATGAIYALTGEWQAGIDACRRSVELSPDPLTTALALGLLGYAYLEKGDTVQAIPLLERAVQETGRFRYRQNQGWFTALLGEAYLLNAQLEKARDLALQGLELTTDAKFLLGAGWAQRVLGRIARTQGTFREAQTYLSRALQTFTSIGARFEVARTHLDLARLATARGRYGDITTHLKEAHRLFTVLRVSRYVERTEQLAEELGAPVPKHHAK